MERITQDEISNRVISIQHAQDNKYADFGGDDLSGLNLRSLDLSGATFIGADLRGVNLRDSRLSYANFHGAIMYDVNLEGADLEEVELRGAIGVHVLTLTSHGYHVLAVWSERKSHWRIQAGCRDYTVSQARKHWGAKHYEHKGDGERIVMMLDWLEKQPIPAVKCLTY